VPEKTYVTLFKNHEDSVPFNELAAYQSRVDTSGNFNIEHIRPGTYKVFALADLNGNQRLDEFEARAFLDSLVVPERLPAIQTDSLKAGTILHDIDDHNLTDSLERDTVIVTKTYSNRPKNLKLYLFKEDNLNQKVLDFSRPSGSRMSVSFQLPTTGEFTFKLLNLDVEPKNMVIEKSLKRDTIQCWISDSLAIKKDTLQVELMYLKKDSIGNNIFFKDTLNFEFKGKQADLVRGRRPVATKKSQKEYLKLNFLVSENKIDLNKNLIIESPTPLANVDPKKLKLFETRDTSVIDTREQKLEKAYRLQKNLLYFKFKRPIANEFLLQGMNFNAIDWYTFTASESKTEYFCQIINETVASKDTINLKVNYDNHFFLNQVQNLRDTVLMPITVQKILSRKRNFPDRIELALHKPLSKDLKIVPEDFVAKGSFFTIEKNSSQDSIRIILTEKAVSDKDTLTFTVKSFDHISMKGDSVFFSETMRVLYRDAPQFIVSTERTKENDIVLAFNKRLEEYPFITPVGIKPDPNWLIMKPNIDGKEITLSSVDKSLIGKDSLELIVDYKDINRKGQTSNLSERIVIVGQKKKDLKAKTEELPETNEKPKPVKIEIFYPAPFTIEQDSIYPRQRIVKSDWKEDTKYILRFDSLAFTDMFGWYSREDKFVFSTRNKDYYATLNLSLNHLKQIAIDGTFSPDSLRADSSNTLGNDEIRKYFGEGHIILQLLGSKDAVVKEYKLFEQEKVKLDFLHPGKYNLRIIFDRNKNGKWDTGNYLKKIQPERVILSAKTIDLKSKFETNLEWDIRESFFKSFIAE
jgi:hypothetical protein